MEDKPSYTVLWASTPEELIKKVKTFISRGYSPQGGVAMAIQEGQITMAQAMVRLSD